MMRTAASNVVADAALSGLICNSAAVDPRRSSNLTAVRESRCLNAVFGMIRHADVTCVVIVYLPPAVGAVVSAH
jgi:hypothetical protein